MSTTNRNAEDLAFQREKRDLYFQRHGSYEDAESIAFVDILDGFAAIPKSSLTSEEISDIHMYIVIAHHAANGSKLAIEILPRFYRHSVMDGRRWFETDLNTVTAIFARSGENAG